MIPVQPSGLLLGWKAAQGMTPPIGALRLLGYVRNFNKHQITRAKGRRRKRGGMREMPWCNSVRIC
jgi:hypothetical protein